MKQRTTKLAPPSCLRQQGFRGAWQRLSMTLLVMVLMTMTAWADALNGTCGKTVDDYVYWEYDVSENTLIISGYGDMADYSDQGGQPWSSYCNDITTIVISDNVTSIGNYAFSGCTNVTEVYVLLDEDDPTLGNNAFDGISGSFYLHGDAYSGAPGWTNLKKTIIYGVDFRAVKTSICAPVFSYGGYDYYEEGATLTLDDGTNYVVTKDEDGSDVTDDVLSGSTLTVPAYDITVMAISGNCGASGNNVTWAYNSNSKVLTISGTGAMADYPDDTEQPWCGYQYDIEEIIIGDYVTHIGDYAFARFYNGNQPLSVTIPSNVTSIGANAFLNCGDLTSITIPSSVTTIGKEAFYGCMGLTSITLEEGLTTINDYAFLNCSSLTSITIPSTVTTIGLGAFESCSSLTSVTILAKSLTTHYYDPFSDTAAGLEIYVPATSVDTYKSYWPNYENNFKELYFDFTTCKVTLPDQTLIPPGTNGFGGLYYKLDYANSNSANAALIEEIGIVVKTNDESTTLVFGTDYQFGTVTGLNGADPYDSEIDDEFEVQIVGKGNYAGTKTKTVKIKNPSGEWGDLTWSIVNGTLTISKKDGVTGNVAMNTTSDYYGYGFPWFSYRDNITAIVIGTGITSVANKAFGAHTGEELYGSVEEITLPSSLTTIGSYAFNGCRNDNLSITVPITVTSVGTDAFAGMASVTATLSDADEAADNPTYLSALAGAQTADVSFSRTFNAGKASTVCLPFEVSPAAAAGKFYNFVGVGYTEQTGWVATMQEPNATTLTANTPYLFKPSGESGTIDVDFSGSLTNLASVLPGETVANTAEGTWTFKGTYKKLTYAAVESNENPFSGKVFGFAANSMGEGEDDVKAGEFVRADDGASIRAFRAFLKYAGDETSLQARGTRRGETVVPEYITVRLIGKNGDVDAIGEISLSTGEVTFESNAWYDLSGRRLAEKPTQRGIYIHKGKKVALH